ncbi:Uncharacterized protein FKW44_006016, partial [Caligus rogercresseyi]
MENIPPDIPHDKGKSRSAENKNKMTYAKILSKREKNVKEALKNIDLTSRFKWDTFVIALTEADSKKAFNNVNMKQLPVYKAALHFGFTEDEIAGAQARYGYGYSSFYTKVPMDIRPRLDLLKKSFTTEVIGPKGDNMSIDMKIKILKISNWKRRTNL